MNTSVSESEASQALSDAEALRNRAQRTALYKGADAIYLIWGVVWAVAFTCQQFLPRTVAHMGRVSTTWSGWVWLVCLAFGGISTTLVFKRRTAVRSPQDRLWGVFWGVLFGYAWLWVFLFTPLFDGKATHSIQTERIFSAYISTVVMFAYVIMGLMGCGRYMLWLGLGVTAVVLTGLIFVPAWYFLWVAVLGGGALMAAGFVTRRQWRKP